MTIARSLETRVRTDLRDAALPDLCRLVCERTPIARATDRTGRAHPRWQSADNRSSPRRVARPARQAPIARRWAGYRRRLPARSRLQPVTLMPDTETTRKLDDL